MEVEHCYDLVSKENKKIQSSSKTVIFVKSVKSRPENGEGRMTVSLISRAEVIHQTDFDGTNAKDPI